MIRRQQLTIEQALQKARHYCAYQERCHQEVKEKLYSFSLGKKDVEEAISRLIEENYLNEERYAIQFAGGRFRMKQWGRVKIRYELKQKQVGEYCIKKALAAIDGEDYLRTLAKLAEGKWETLRDEPQPFIRRKKLQDYLLQKGYESGLVSEAIRQADALADGD
ncbi:MAG TPA: RecX family transcriptional regulator [Puia sp.]|nr:RecX family transcriptional regulator [Puia sp.]